MVKTLAWKLKAKLHRMSLNMVRWISWKSPGLSEDAAKFIFSLGAITFDLRGQTCNF